MNLPDFLQLAGGGAEIAGLLIAAAGIAATRRKFTKKASLVSRSVAAVRRAVPLLRPKEKHAVGGSVTASWDVGATAIGSKKYTWSGVPLEKRVSLLQEMTDRHEDWLARLEGDLRKEGRLRTSGDQRAETQLHEAKIQLEALVNAAAAGGITKESLGVTLFIIGVVLTTWGGLIS